MVRTRRARGRKKKKKICSFHFYLQAKLRNKFYILRDDLFKPCLVEAYCIKNHFVSLTLATYDHLLFCAPSSQDNSRGKCLEKAPLFTCYSPNNITKLTYYSSNNTVMFTCHSSNTTASWLVISQMLPCLLVIPPHVITTSLTCYSFSYTTAGLYLVIAHVLLIHLFAISLLPLLQHVVPLWERKCYRSVYFCNPYTDSLFPLHACCVHLEAIVNTHWKTPNLLVEETAVPQFGVKAACSIDF